MIKLKSYLPLAIQWLLLSFVFLLPFYEPLLPPVLFIIFLFSFIDILLRKPIIRISPPLILLILFYFAYLLGVIYSDNQHAAWDDIQTKLTFLLFPLFFLFEYKLALDIFKQLAIAFISGEFFALIFCWGHALWNFFLTGNTDMLFYDRFSYFIHTSYFSMYVLFAIIIIFIFIQRNLLSHKFLWFAISFFFFLSLFFIASKTGFILGTLFFTIFLFSSYTFFKKIWQKYLVLSVLILFAIFLGAKNYRIHQLFIQSYNIYNIPPNTSGSFSVRILIWQASKDIIKENFWIGVGTGDTHNILQKKYKEKGFSGASKHRYNAHNQYISTFIGLGITGFLLLITILLYGFYYAVKNKDMLLLLFLLNVSLNFLTESMLNRQAGVIFFTFFYSLLSVKNYT
ncbi:MAG TPA: O-antigen ligase family protein [Bacteroidales bacterium]|nr:O-antigen ligase family protein [Bacteroidales bacterium]